jgi:uncharacterized iron-regulated membrane protein
MKLLRRALILGHRYLGIALSALIVMWFATGIAMMYAGGMPRLTPELRLERLPNLDLSRVQMTPAQAAERAEVGANPGRAVLLTVMDHPAYRFGGREPVTIFADSGQLLDGATLEQSRTIAAHFMNLANDRIEFVRTLDEDVDQWTLLQGRQLPLHKFRVSDDAGTELYVSPATGEVAVMTTRKGRALAWISTIPHWLYFTALRTNQPLWYRTVVWTSTLACVLALIGLVLGLTQWRRQKPLIASIPYSGWMRWHYITGVVFGVFTLTWAFSGLLSMEPYAWTNANGLELPRDVFTGGAADLTKFPAMEPASWNRLLEGRGIKEVEFERIQDQEYFVVRAEGAAVQQGRFERLHQPYQVTGRAERDRVLVSAATLEIRDQPFTADSLVARLKTAVPDAGITEQQLLADYDSYYYSRDRQTPLPVLRVKFDDPAQTWVYIDPEMSQVLASVHKLNRVERWLYNGLHSFDFAFWYNSIAWDVTMIALCLGGLASSGIGLFLGVRRMRRAAGRTVAAWDPKRVVPTSAGDVIR